jgi:hypothetical protein
MELGSLTGQHRALSLIANRCSAADAECLKTIRDSGAYKELDVTWEEYCVRYAGISRSYADSVIQCFEEYGDRYRRMAEIISMSPPTFRLIESSVTDEGLDFHGECIELVPRNRERIAEAVKTIRAEKRAAKTAIVNSESLNRALEKLVTNVISIANRPDRRAEVMVFVERASGRFEALAQGLRQTTLLVE